MRQSPNTLARGCTLGAFRGTNEGWWVGSSGTYSCMFEGKETLNMIQLGRILLPVPVRGVPNLHSVPLVYPHLSWLHVPPHTWDAQIRPRQSHHASCTYPIHGGSRPARVTSTIMTRRASNMGPVNPHKALFTVGRTMRAGGHLAAPSAIFLRRAPQPKCILPSYHLQYHQASSCGRVHRLFDSNVLS